MSNEEKKTPRKKPCNYEIRSAALKDLEFVYQIEVVSFRDAYPKTLLWQLIKDKKAICHIIEIEQKIIGFAVGLMRSNNKGHIISIAIIPKYRNCNYGSSLLKYLIADLRNHGASIIQLEVRISNNIAIKLYKNFDFLISATKRRYYSDGEDAYVMSCRLNEKNL